MTSVLAVASVLVLLVVLYVRFALWVSSLLERRREELELADLLLDLELARRRAARDEGRGPTLPVSLPPKTERAQ